MIINNLKSPNYSRISRKNKDIKLIVIHYTGMQSRIESIKRLISRKHKVSCHYFIDRKGKVLKMVDENKVAWHAGKSRWKNFKNINKNSIGIELVNKGHEFGYQKFTNLQIRKLIKLCSSLKKKYKIKNSNIIGHSDIAPTRKKDPGEKFPWNRLHKNQLGLWLNHLKYKTPKIDNFEIRNIFFKNLYKLGYRYFSLKRRSQNDIFLIKAFQRHFIQQKIDGKIDQKTLKISHFLANHLKN